MLHEILAESPEATTLKESHLAVNICNKLSLTEICALYDVFQQNIPVEIIQNYRKNDDYYYNKSYKILQKKFSTLESNCVLTLIDRSFPLFLYLLPNGIGELSFDRRNHIIYLNFASVATFTTCFNSEMKIPIKSFKNLCRLAIPHTSPVMYCEEFQKEYTQYYGW